ncbi:MAG: 6-phosphogluconolactonase [Myxococcales bacterium]|nr:6-phosphogluconolactonase [Myxococcales bacterium]
MESSSPAECADRLATAVSTALAHTLALGRPASLVVSGGSTPLPFFHALRDRVLPWARVSVLLADERQVPPDHRDSNERLVREHLLTAGHAASAATWIPLLEDAIRPLLPFTAVVLGMGADGHTASLFPEAPDRDTLLDPEGTALVAPVTPSIAPHPRLTLTLAALAQSRARFLHITGADKRSVFDAAIASSTAGTARLPIARVHAAAPLQVFWSP